MRKIQITYKRDLDQVLIGLRDYVKNKDSTRKFAEIVQFLHLQNGTQQGVCGEGDTWYQAEHLE